MGARRCTFAARGAGEYTFGMRWRLAVAVLVLGGLWVGCAKQEPEPELRISAAQLGHTIPPGSLAAQMPRSVIKPVTSRAGVMSKA